MVFYAFSTLPAISQLHRWTQSNDGLSNLRVTCLATMTNGVVLTGTDNGVFFSSNGGVSWDPRSSGLNYTIITSIGTNLRNRILAGTERRNGRYDLHAENVVSTDSGISWQVLDIGHPGYAFITMATKDSADIYAVTRHVDYYTFPYRYLVHSSDSGITWETLRAITLGASAVFKLVTSRTLEKSFC